jgi:hypothetical protein
LIIGTATAALYLTMLARSSFSLLVFLYNTANKDRRHKPWPIQGCTKKVNSSYYDVVSNVTMAKRISRGRQQVRVCWRKRQLLMSAWLKSNRIEPMMGNVCDSGLRPEHDNALAKRSLAFGWIDRRIPIEMPRNIAIIGWRLVCVSWAGIRKTKQTAPPSSLLSNS